MAIECVLTAERDASAANRTYKKISGQNPVGRGGPFGFCGPAA